MTSSNKQEANTKAELADPIVWIKCKDCGEKIMFDMEDESMVDGSCHCGHEYSVHITMTVYKDTTNDTRDE